MSKALDLTTLMSTKLCHDLTGPISAINNGIELLEDMGDDPEMQAEAMKLILSSAGEASRRLQFYRLAFGHLAASEPSPLLSRRAIIDGFFQATKVKVQFPEEMKPISQQLIRLCFNLLIIASGSLIRGGEITISEDANAIKFIATGGSVRIDPSYIEVLNGNTNIEPSDPKTVHLSLIDTLLKDEGASLQVELTSEDKLQIILNSTTSNSN